LEKEKACALHQTGRNSGVIHSGLYYQPGSLKARFARQGSQSLVHFCQEHGIPHKVCGKMVVATRREQLPQLGKLYQRGLENQLPVEKLSAAQVTEKEPFVQGVAGLCVSSTGIVDYTVVCNKLSELLRQQGGQILYHRTVTRIKLRSGIYAIETEANVIETKSFVNCAGLYCDHLAKCAGVDPRLQIVPFRGEYYELTPQKTPLVKGLIYPVPNPAFPFLGVHFTRMINGSVHAGPNAVLAFAREGYAKSTISVTELAETLLFPGFWRLISKHMGEGLKEMHRSVSKRKFLASLQEMIPAVQMQDLVPCKSGIRAQALKRDGSLVDDFHLIQDRRSLHVCNAPSPAATASLEIGRHIASLLDLT
jgi:L-2-hydroxyglutarate oxidase